MIDISQIATISIKYPHLQDKECDLPFFIRHTKKGNELIKSGTALVYGLNGSGKSTLTKSLLSLQVPMNERSHPGNITLKSLNGTKIDTTEEVPVVVFDDNFIRNNISELPNLDDEMGSVAPIILIGESAGASDKLAKLDKEIVSFESESNQKHSDLDLLQKDINATHRDLDGALKSTSGGTYSSWRLRSDSIQSRLNLTQQTKEAIISIKPPTVDEYHSYGKKFSELRHKISTAKNAKRIEKSLSTYSLPSNLEQIENLLQQDLSPKLADDASWIDQLISSLSVEELKTRRHEVFREGITTCPHCFQNLPTDFRERFAQAIDERLSKLTESDVQKQLEFLKLPEDNDPNRVISEAISGHIDIDNFRSLLQQYVALQKEVNLQIDNKLSKPQETYTISNIDFTLVLQALNVSVEEINNRISAYNSLPDSLNQLIEEAKNINILLSSFEAKDIIVRLNEAQSQYNKLNDAAQKLDEKINSLNTEKIQLEASIKRHDIAVNDINELLRIAFGNDAIKLKVREDGNPGYDVINRGSQVNPSHLSTGEKNILGLCYFFVKTVEGGDFRKDLGAGKLIVLDDPISSFDFDNKYGVTALISFLLHQIHSKEHQSSKCIILTHDISVVWQLENLLKDQLHGNRIAWRLGRDGKLSEFNVSEHDIYKGHLQYLFDIAKDNISSMIDNEVSNRFRRVWEGFASFELGQSKPTDVVSSPQTRALFEDSYTARIANFLNTFPARPYINPDSHSHFQIMSCNYGLLPTLSPDNYLRFIREALVFIHIVAPNHIPGRLANSKEDVQPIRASMNKMTQEVLENFKES
ncbi:AAA family ATPase [Arcanobacterium ihumii]|uniref:AAA family ATPase n=1 Tax=Arcanobacterium ihumii TaxID=2138162 RepID=UPI001F3B5D43|nr:AAA family ATPase [Arcanobacterium ihumii]